MALQRHYLDKIMLSLLDKEATYDAGPGGWTSTSVMSMLDFDDASAHELWDDAIQTDVDVLTGKEFISVQEIARQSMRLTYAEPRTKPNTLAGLLSLCLGTVAATQDGVLTAYRHRISPASAISLPSIGAQTLRENGVQRKYTGIKGEQFTLNENGAYVNFGCQMIGSGTRATAADAFPAAVSETWLRWGDAKIYVKNTAGTPISTVLATPSQTAANLGGSEVNLSTRMLSWSLNWVNNLQADAGYRASTGLVRKDFHPARRTATLSMAIEVDDTTEATDLNYYLNQSKLAVELNINSGTLVATGGAFNFGAIVILPRVQLTSIPRGETNQLETLQFVGALEDDGTNPIMLAFIYNTKAAYLV